MARQTELLFSKTLLWNTLSTVYASRQSKSQAFFELPGHFSNRWFGEQSKDAPTGLPNLQGSETSIYGRVRRVPRGSFPCVLSDQHLPKQKACGTGPAPSESACDDIKTANPHEDGHLLEAQNQVETSGSCWWPFRSVCPATTAIRTVVISLAMSALCRK